MSVGRLGTNDSNQSSLTEVWFPSQCNGILRKANNAIEAIFSIEKQNHISVDYLSIFSFVWEIEIKSPDREERTFEMQRILPLGINL